jgi:hypothetical protein
MPADGRWDLTQRLKGFLLLLEVNISTIHFIAISALEKLNLTV